jgi:hypothetical protein
MLTSLPENAPFARIFPIFIADTRKDVACYCCGDDHLQVSISVDSIHGRQDVTIALCERCFEHLRRWIGARRAIAREEM